MDLKDISKYISLILRHKPETIGITLDEHGWANVDELITGISKTRNFDMEMLEEIVRTDEKQRYSFNDDKTLIRANQGHSIPVDVGLERVVPPKYLYHGTGEKYCESIDIQGLIPKSRLYVHLSQDIETAVNVGKRHGEPVVYRVSSKKMYEAGFVFFRSANGVWLTACVPTQYIKRETFNEKELEEMEEINDSIVIKSAETDEELCGRGYVHCTAWKESYRGIVCDRYLDTMSVEATTARARNFPDNTLVAKDGDKVVGFAVYSPSRDEDLPDAGEVDAIYVLSEYYGRKVGYRLMNEALSRLSEYNTFFVWVLEKNERAIEFYHKYGFEFDGCKKEWTLGTPVSIVRMVMKRA